MSINLNLGVQGGGDAHSFLLPSGRKRSRGNKDDADACVTDFFREEVGFCGAGEGHLDAAACLGFDFGFE